MKKTVLASLLAMFLFGFYTDVTQDDPNTTSCLSAGCKSESSFGYQRGRGI